MLLTPALDDFFKKPAVVAFCMLFSGTVFFIDLLGSVARYNSFLIILILPAVGAFYARGAHCAIKMKSIKGIYCIVLIASLYCALKFLLSVPFELSLFYFFKTYLFLPAVFLVSFLSLSTFYFSKNLKGVLYYGLAFFVGIITPILLSLMIGLMVIFDFQTSKNVYCAKNQKSHICTD